MTTSTAAIHFKWPVLRFNVAALRVWLPAVACACVVFLAAFSAPVDVAEGRAISIPITPFKLPSVLLKLATAAAAGLIGVWGVYCLPRVRQLLLSLPGILLCVVAILFFIAIPTSVSQSSLAIALVFVCYLLFVPTCLVVLQARGLTVAMYGGILLYTLLSLILYLFLPRYGVYIEDFGGGIFATRLGGLSQPNQTGRMAAIGLLLSSFFFRHAPGNRWWHAAAAMLCLAVAWLAMSRTALLGCAVCLVIAHWDLIMTRLGLTVVAIVTISASIILFGMAASGYEETLLKKVVGLFSKTGDVEELTTVTGRADIWQETLRLISRRPLQGYGLGSAKVLLIDHLQSTHNILLHPTLAAGIGAGLITLALLLWNLLNVFIFPHALIRTLAAYILISGLTEDTIYETFPGVFTLMWLMCCFVPQMPSSSLGWFQSQAQQKL